MPSLYDTVKQYFDQEHWPYEPMQDMTGLQLAYRTRNNAWSCYAHALEDDQQFIFYSLAPLQVPAKKRWLALEYIIRAGYNLPIGGFEMDLDELLVRYKTSIDVEGDRLSYPLFRAVVYSNLAVMERYLPGLQAVAFEEVTPRDALAAVEHA
jgi:hypothetical protein